MLNIQVYVADVLIEAALQPGEGLASSEKVLVGLKEHDEGQSAGHQVLGEHAVTIFTVLALLVLGYGLLLRRFTLSSRIIVSEHSDVPHIHLFLQVAKYKSPGVDEPPVASLVLDEISNELLELHLQLLEQVPSDIVNVNQSLF